jgi:hypothetical protein
MKKKKDIKTDEADGENTYSRRRFLKSIAKGTVYVPPVIMSMAITENLYAQMSGGSGGMGMGMGMGMM